MPGGADIAERARQDIGASRLSRNPLWLMFASSLGVLLIVASVGAYVWLRGGDTSARLAGTNISGEPAPGFTLTNQHGDAVALADQRGKVTVLTFLYTNCPDVCPLTAAQLRNVQEELGAEARHISMLAVSVDPERDTVAAAYEFSARLRLEERWSFLVGSGDELEPIWEAYFVGVAAESEVAPHEHDADEEPHEADDRLLHTAPVFLIDHTGALRVVHTTGNDPGSITNNLLRDIRILVDEIPASARI